MPIIYTVITGGVDDLKEPLVITPGWAYVCITDDTGLTSKHWKMWHVPNHKYSKRDFAKYVKLLPPFGSKSIYIDASFYVNCDLNEFWDKYYVEGKLCTMQHPWRNCPYTEIDEVLATSKDTVENCNRVRALLELEGILPNSGMCASGIILRDGGTDEFCQLWYDMYQRTGPRDQLSWARVNKIYPDITHRFNFDYRERTEFLHVPHNTRPRKKAARLADYRKRGLI